METKFVFDQNVRIVTGFYRGHVVRVRRVEMPKKKSWFRWYPRTEPAYDVHHYMIDGPFLESELAPLSDHCEACGRDSK